MSEGIYSANDTKIAALYNQEKSYRAIVLETGIGYGTVTSRVAKMIAHGILIRRGKPPTPFGLALKAQKRRVTTNKPRQAAMAARHTV